MKTLALLSLAAAATAIPTVASAQSRAGHSWGQPGRGAERAAERVVVRHAPGPIARAPGMHREYRQFRRIGRGQILPTFWAAPQFHVQHWQGYGFPQPMPGYRWVRYYDDALLVDPRGRVHDSRSDYDWDRYGDRWSRDESGIPMYVGNGDYRPDGRDYRWAEEADEGGWDYSEYGDAEHRGGSCGGERRGSPCGGPGHGSGHGGGYAHGGYRPSHSSGGYSSGHSSGGYSSGYSGGGYGYGYGGATVTITETIVEGGGAQVIEETVYEEVVETRARARRAAPRRPAPVRRPIRGERG